MRLTLGAAVRRWTRARFGDASFAALGLPGGEIVDAGLDALIADEVTAESLAVSLAAPRLRREGVPVPSSTFPDPEMRLYRLLEQKAGGLAHARYLAYLRQLESSARLGRLQTHVTRLLSVECAHDEFSCGHLPALKLGKQP